jgi:hypothetical protein
MTVYLFNGRFPILAGKALLIARSRRTLVAPGEREKAAAVHR